MFLNKILKIYSEVRTKYFTYCAKVALESFGTKLRVNSKCHFGRKTSVKNNCHFNGTVVNGVGRLLIGNHFHSGTEILIITSSHNYKSEKLLPYDHSEIIGDVIIGDCVWLGSRVILLPGTKLGDGVVVQAGSVVHGKIPDCAVIGGNPAKILFYRNKSSFEKLYKENMFL